MTDTWIDFFVPFTGVMWVMFLLPEIINTWNRPSLFRIIIDVKFNP